MRTASWVIVRKEDGAAIAETFSERVVIAINTAKYEAVPILQYLVNLNRQIKDQAPR